jgi:hypothetical protein
MASTVIQYFIPGSHKNGINPLLFLLAESNLAFLPWHVKLFFALNDAPIL